MLPTMAEIAQSIQVPARGTVDLGGHQFSREEHADLPGCAVPYGTIAEVLYRVDGDEATGYTPEAGPAVRWVGSPNYPGITWIHDVVCWPIMDLRSNRDG